MSFVVDTVTITLERNQVEDMLPCVASAGLRAQDAHTTLLLVDLADAMRAALQP